MLQSLVGTLLHSAQRWSMVVLYCREISATYCTCCFSLVNNPVLSSVLYGAFRARAVYGYREWIHRNIFSSDISSSGRCLSFALCTFPILRCNVSFILPYIQMRFFLTLSDLEILSVNCFAFLTCILYTCLPFADVYYFACCMQMCMLLACLLFCGCVKCRVSYAVKRNDSNPVPVGTIGVIVYIEVVRLRAYIPFLDHFDD